MNEPAVKKSALVVATLASFITPFMGSSLNIALPAIAREFQMDAVLLAWVPTAFILAAAVFMVPVGRLADLHGRKWMFLNGMIVFTITSLGAGLSQSAAMLIVCRAIEGAGSAMIFATGIAILTSVYPPSERGRVLGINIAAVYVGLALGPVIGGFLTQSFGWRSLFVVAVAFGLTAIVITTWKLKQEWADARGEKFDLVGSVVYGVSLVAIMSGVSFLPDRISLIPILAGIAGLFIFYNIEARIEHPVFNTTLFATNRTFTFSNIAALINYSATFAVTFLMSLYLHHLKGLEPRPAGLVLIASPIVMAVVSPIAGRLSDRVEPRIVASLGMAISTGGLVMLIFLNAETSYVYIVASLLVLGLGFGLFSSPNTNAILSSVEKRHYGLASGAVGTMRLLGQMTSMAMATLVFALFIGHVQITPAVHPALTASLRVVFTLSALMCAAGVLASLARGKVRKQG